MKREILFRGFCPNKSGDKTIILDEEEIMGDWHYWNCFDGINRLNAGFMVTDTVGMWTGLTDKNGKKIFEGDRVRYGERIDFDCHEESIRYPEAYGGKIYDIGIFEDVVVWCGGNGYPAFDLENHDMECNALSVISSAGDYVIEVIGTIFDKEARNE